MHILFSLLYHFMPKSVLVRQKKQENSRFSLYLVAGGGFEPPTLRV